MFRNFFILHLIHFNIHRQIYHNYVQNVNLPIDLRKVKKDNPKTIHFIILPPQTKISLYSLFINTIFIYKYKLIYFKYKVFALLRNFSKGWKYNRYLQYFFN
jgi:hypothetical protein